MRIVTLRTAGVALLCAGFASGLVFAQDRAERHDAVAHRIGVLSLLPLTDSSPSVVALKEGLRDLGYAEGQDYVLAIRSAGEDPGRYPALIAELSQLSVELIVAGSTAAAVAIHETKPSMPVVVARGPDLVGAGLAETADHPGGAVTGIEELAAGVVTKRLQLLKEAVPAIRRVAILSAAPTEGTHAIQYREAEQAAVEAQVTLRTFRVSGATDFDRVFDDIANGGSDGLVVFNGVLPRLVQRRIVALAAERHLPAIYPLSDFVEAGGLMSYGPRSPEMFRFAATYVARILKGAKPGDLPLTKWTRMSLTVNATAAVGLGITLPPSLLAQAALVVK